MSPRAANTFSLAEIAALLRVAAAADRRDADAAQRYAQTPAALTARRKLQGMRERMAAAPVPERPKATKPEPEPEPEVVPPPKRYVSRRSQELRARRGAAR